MSNFHIYTDGACSGNPGPGGWGVVILDDRERLLTEFSGFASSTTNNRMEVQAAISGIRKVLELSNSPHITLYSDSNYLIQAYTKGWMDSWLRTNWKKGTVKNQELWQELNAVLRHVTIRWVKVKGHADNTYNNRCDHLAVEAIKQNAPGSPVLEEAIVVTPTPVQQHGEISSKQVVPPPFDPVVLNYSLSKKPSENRCLVTLTDFEQNVGKIRQIAERFSYEELKRCFDTDTLQSITNWVSIATFDHPTIKVHPFFLQVGDMADFWLRNNQFAGSAPNRQNLIKLMCAFIAEYGVAKARVLGLDNS